MYYYLLTSKACKPCLQAGGEYGRNKSIKPNTIISYPKTKVYIISASEEIYGNDLNCPFRLTVSLYFRIIFLMITYKSKERIYSLRIYVSHKHVSYL